MNIAQLIKGNKKFKSINFPKLEGTFDQLVEDGQKPNILFIGCSDSRVVPDLIVSSNPGDMFILRNIGNFVPPYKGDNDYHGSSAAIEYAVSILEVSDIIVCGHSHCGACKSLYEDFSNKPYLAHVQKWLELGKTAKDEVMQKYNDFETQKNNIYKDTEKTSIKHQLENLLTYPEVSRKIKESTLQIHGWYYKIEDGSIETYDTTHQEFRPL